MISSLGVGDGHRYGGPQHVPHVHNSSFLSVGTPGVSLGASDLGTLLRAMNAPVRRPQRVPLFATPPSGLAQAAPGAIVRPASSGRGFNLQHYSEGKLVAATVKNMHKAVLAAKTSAKWREKMERIRQEGRRRGAIGWKDYWGELQWMNHYLRVIHPIDYVRDPYQIEMVMHPEETLRKGLGDCDDSSTLWAGSAGTLGAAHKFRTYRADPKRPQEWTHVVCQIWVPGRGWVNNDMTIRNAPLGFEPDGFPYKDWLEPRW